MRRIARVVTAVLLTLSGPAVTAAVAYDQLNAEWWTSAEHRPPRAERPAPAEAEPLPAPSPQGAPEPPADRHPREVGTCVTPAAAPTPCTSAGALRVVASLHTHRGQPCHDTPETTHTRRVGEYTLCLATL